MTFQLLNIGKMTFDLVANFTVLMIGFSPNMEGMFLNSYNITIPECQTGST